MSESLSSPIEPISYEAVILPGKAYGEPPEEKSAVPPFVIIFFMVVVASLSTIVAALILIFRKQKQKKKGVEMDNAAAEVILEGTLKAVRQLDIAEQVLTQNQETANQVLYESLSTAFPEYSPDDLVEYVLGFNLETATVEEFEIISAATGMDEIYFEANNFLLAIKALFRFLASLDLCDQAGQPIDEDSVRRLALILVLRMDLEEYLNYLLEGWVAALNTRMEACKTEMGPETPLEL